MSGQKPQFGIPIPQVFMNGKADVDLVARTLRRAEELGYHSAWVQDQVAGEAPVLESLSLLCFAAAHTSTLKLGVSVIVFPIRNAVQMAKDVATLDQLSNGRAIIGIGLGPVFAGDSYFGIFNTRAADALGRFNEGLAVMKSLWTNEHTSIDGKHYHLKKTAMEPKPVQRPHPPIWFGGQHPKALHRAVRHGDGYMGAGPTTTRNFAKQVAHVRRFLDEEQRDPATFPISKRVYLALDDDEDRAKAGLDKFFQARYPWMVDANPNFVADICVWGSAQRVTDGLAEVLDAGAGMIVLNPLWDFVEQLEALASDVIPNLG